MKERAYEHMVLGAYIVTFILAAAIMTIQSVISKTRRARIMYEDDIHTEGQYVVSGGADQHWIGTNAKTLRGAKIMASKIYQAAVGGKIEIAQIRDEQYIRCAVKYGHDKWQSE